MYYTMYVHIEKTNHYSANSFISLLSTVPQVCAYYFHTRNDYIDLVPMNCDRYILNNSVNNSNSQINNQTTLHHCRTI